MWRNQGKGGWLQDNVIDVDALPADMPQVGRPQPRAHVIDVDALLADVAHVVRPHQTTFIPGVDRRPMVSNTSSPSTTTPPDGSSTDSTLGPPSSNWQLWTANNTSTEMGRDFLLHQSGAASGVSQAPEKEEDLS
jgi:hypothetical protein